MTANPALLLCALLALAPSARASLISLDASGTISVNTSGSAAIPVGTPWAFELIYDTASPDRDFELTGSPTPTFGRFDNTGAIPALTFFHYRAGSYEVTLHGPADFGTGSGMDTTFGGVHALDINIHAPEAFPSLGGGAVSFHADFNDFSSRPIFVSDALPTDPALGPGSFDMSTVSLLPPSSEVSSSILTTFTITAVPEPSSFLALGFLLLLVAGSREGSRCEG